MIVSLDLLAAVVLTPSTQLAFCAAWVCCWFIFNLPTRTHTSFYAMLLPSLSWFLGILHLKVQDFAFVLADVHEVLAAC